MSQFQGLIEQLSQIKGELVSEYKRLVVAKMDYFKSLYGSDLGGIYNSIHYFSFSEIIRPNYSEKRESTMPSCKTEWVLNESRLAANAQKYAEQTVASWAEKTHAKLGGLEEVEYSSQSYTGFVIVGRKCGATVRIDQQRIMNVSSKGKVFNQYPALIYVDGKKVSEAKYKAMFT